MTVAIKCKPFVIKFEVGMVIEKDEFGFVAYCPALKGLTVEGETEDEVKKNFSDAFISYINSALKHNDPLPVCSFFNVTKGVKPIIESIDVPIDFFDKSLLAHA